MKWFTSKKRKSSFRRYVYEYEKKLDFKFNFNEIKFYIFITKEGIKDWKYFTYILKNPDFNTTNEMICAYCSSKFYKGNKTSNTNLEYLTLIYGIEVAKDKVKEHSKRVKGNKNPGYNHQGRLSPFSKKFIKGDVRKETIKKANKTKQDNPLNNPMHRDYYLPQCNCNYDIADFLFRERQATGRKDKFIERYGEEEGLRRWKERQKKWLKSYRKSNFSKISQDLFWNIVDVFGTDGITFAELEYCKAYFDGSNKEKVIKTSKSFIKADFIYKNKIIEFDGDYWHGKNGNIQRETKRDKYLMNKNYKILHIKECDYNKNKEKEIKKCLRFLNDQSI
jgi:hypothetical protein